MTNLTRKRKLEHIDIVVKENVEPKITTLLEDIALGHNASPDLDFNEVDTSVVFLGKRINAPIMIEAMTGGHPNTATINEALAEIAEEVGIPIGVGSQRAAIEDKSLEYTFSIVREKAQSVPVIANIGGAQIVKGYTAKELLRAISMVKADAIAIHLNPAQEVFQTEGDKNFSKLVDIVSVLVDELPVPIIIKETGNGLLGQVARMYAEVGIEYFDVSGLGGTNWVIVEGIRSSNSVIKDLSNEFSVWGVPTAIAVIDVLYQVPSATIIASGGIRSSLDVSKAIALGANIVGIAGPIIKLLLTKGKDEVKKYIEKLIAGLKISMFLTSSKKPYDLWCKQLVIGTSLEKWLRSLNIDVHEYMELRCLRREQLISG